MGGTLVLNNAIYLTVPYLAQFNSDVHLQTLELGRWTQKGASTGRIGDISILNVHQIGPYLLARRPVNTVDIL